MVTVEKIEKWLNRSKPPVYTRYKDIKRKSGNLYLVEPDFEYYVCDYCGSAVRIKEKGQEGGEFILPASRLKKGNARVVAHHVCLNKMLKEIDEIFLKGEIV